MKNINYFINNYNTIYLSWATKYEGNPYINFGDELSIYINKKLFPNLTFSHCSFNSNKTRLVSIGTILHEFYNGKVLVWGSGLDKNRLHSKFNADVFEIYAVRGKKTKSFLENFDKKVPDIFGDPAILLNDYIQPKKIKKNKLGIIPHCSNLYVKYNILTTDTICFKQPDNTEIKIIYPKTDQSVETVLEEIIDCECILSESIHGCIIADALNIPNLFLSKRNNELNKIISTFKLDNLEHRYDDYTSIMDIEKFQIIHDENNDLDYSKIYDLIHQFYKPYDFCHHKKLLKENHPLNF